MEEFTCGCNWRYIVGSKQFYGPVYVGVEAEYKRGIFIDDATNALIRPISEFREGYGDCWREWRRRKKVK